MYQIRQGVRGFTEDIDPSLDVFTYIYPFWNINFMEDNAKKGKRTTIQSPAVVEYVSNLENHILNFEGAVVVVDTAVEVMNTLLHFLPFRRMKPTYFLATEDTEVKDLYNISLDDAVDFIGQFNGSKRAIAGRCIRDSDTYSGCVGSFAKILKGYGMEPEIYRDLTLTHHNEKPEHLLRAGLKLV